MARRSIQWPQTQETQPGENNILILQALLELPRLDLESFFSDTGNREWQDFTQYAATAKFSREPTETQLNVLLRMLERLKRLFAYCEGQCERYEKKGHYAPTKKREDFKNWDPMQLIGDGCLFLECMSRSLLKSLFSSRSWLWKCEPLANGIIQNLYPWTVLWSKKSPEFEKAIEALAEHLEQHTVGSDVCLHNFFSEYKWMHYYCPELEQALDRFTKSRNKPLNASYREILINFFSILPYLLIRASKEPLAIISRASVCSFDEMSVQPEVLELMKAYSEITSSRNY
eukprot:Gregarina_sp_Poly_1__373@NODE_1092_length_5120_cov_13_801306_g757_i0_p2_GENE_NODE_1092_length_5120_cov_13_801306_g757_i0NODE_1092_length_5120_cov_13_801306_g757_i0_p2_ORF_typecomplete_len287_score35_37HeLo/PF14479_6/0_018SMC_ScpB/PF04079_16/0_18SMC_ScpB/PF04079_16/1_1e03_NODE_1092_length_5120_cov_13_801306_g757_i07561616